MIKKIAILILTVGIFANCSSSDEENIPSTSFDRGAMLTNLADNIIIPLYQNFSVTMNTLKADGSVFVATPTQDNLNKLRISWKAAYKSWQNIEMYNLGEAENLQYKFYMNIYPLSVTDVENNIASGNYDLAIANNHDAQGFPALDYLLYGVANTDASILEKYTTDANSQGYKTYLTDVLNQMSTLTNQVVSDWETSYRSEFITSTSNTATSAVNKLVNDYVFYYEKGLRANKIGIPAGIFSADALPEKVEAFYNNEISKELALESLQAVVNLFEGANGTGLEEYLEALDREDLATAISAQFISAKTQIENLNPSFSLQVSSDNSQMTLAYDELQKAVVLLKVDMLQAFNISVDYVDADGD